MKQWLAWVTVVGTLAVVGVLASYLVLTAVSLIRADRNLARLIEGLRMVRDNTEPLDRDLATIHDATVALRERLTSIDTHLAGAIRLLGGAGETRQDI